MELVFTLLLLFWAMGLIILIIATIVDWRNNK